MIGEIMSPNEIARIWDFLTKINEKISALEISTKEMQFSFKHTENLLTALTTEYKRARECELEMGSMKRAVQRIEKKKCENETNWTRVLFKVVEWVVIFAFSLLLTGRL